MGKLFFKNHDISKPVIDLNDPTTEVIETVEPSKDPESATKPEIYEPTENTSNNEEEFEVFDEEKDSEKMKKIVIKNKIYYISEVQATYFARLFDIFLNIYLQNENFNYYTEMSKRKNLFVNKFLKYEANGF